MKARLLMESSVHVLKTVIKDSVTESDNLTYDLGRIIWGIGSLVFFAISLIAVWTHNWAFNPITWGTGFGAVLAGGGACIAIKSRET